MKFCKLLHFDQLPGSAPDTPFTSFIWKDWSNVQDSHSAGRVLTKEAPGLLSENLVRFAHVFQEDGSVPLKLPSELVISSL